ncbi:hypothetical protein, partial [Klebsiella pneumoniae]
MWRLKMTRGLIKKTLKSAEAEALKVALDAAQVEYVPVTALVKSPLNVR